jgi:L-iditol 2-dehydrogenase
VTPETNRVAVLYGPRDLRVETRPLAEPGPHEVVVEVAAVGVCGSDVHYYEHGRVGSRVVKDPLILGHEVCGRVAALGPGVSGHRLGDRVVLEPGASCRRCRECRAGRYNLCGDVRFLGSPRSTARWRAMSSRRRTSCSACRRASPTRRAL